MRRYVILVCNQPSLGCTQPPTVRRMGYKYWPRGCDSALQLGRNRRFDVTLVKHHTLWYIQLWPCWSQKRS